MYADFFSLSGMPFSLLPDAAFLYPSKRHKRALAHLEYGVATHAGFIVITGEVGTGKTTVLRRYLKSADKSIVVGVITNPSAAFGSPLRWIAHAYDLAATGDDAALYHRFVEFLLKKYAHGQRVALVIDEAQNLAADALEELRMLSNVNNEKDLLLQIVLLGQPELLTTLQNPNLRQFVQRIAVHCHLETLGPEETTAYIRHRLDVVGGAPDIFEDDACAAVYRHTQGVPRLINLLCDQALVYAFSDDQKTVTAALVSQAVQDRLSSGLSPFTL